MYAVLQVPRFALQAVLRHEPPLRTRPVALVDPDTTPPRVVEATPSALEQGVSAGLTAPQALARCRVVSIRARVAAQETAATEALLQCAYGFSPHIESTAPGVITLDLRGLIELRPANGGASAGAEGSEDRALDAWGERLRSAVASLGLDARVGVGPTPNVARHAARWGRGGGGGVEPGVRVVTDPAEFVAGLPVAALEPSTHVVEILQGWGIRTVGELLVLGQASLAERLGLEALGLFAAASVTACRPLKLVKPAERFEETHEFDPGIETLEPLLFLLRRFTESLVRRMEAFGWVVGELRLGLWLESGRMLESRLRVPQPSRRADVLFRMLHTHLEPLRTDSSIVRVGLAAEATRPEQRQFGLFECALRDPNQFQETLARLAALVGADRVGSPVREDSHRPDAFTLVPPDFDGESRGAGRWGGGVSSPSRGVDPRDGVVGGAGGSGTPDWMRPVPMRRLRPAPAARVEMTREDPGMSGRGVGTDGGEGGDEGGDEGGESEVRPVGLESSAARGRIAESLGPWRISGHWWEAGGWEREEWDVALRGGRVVRLVRTGDSWSVEAVLD